MVSPVKEKINISSLSVDPLLEDESSTSKVDAKTASEFFKIHAREDAVTPVTPARKISGQKYNEAKGVLRVFL